MTYYIPFIILVIVLLISVVYLNRQTKESFSGPVYSGASEPKSISNRSLEASDITSKVSNYGETIYTNKIELSGDDAAAKICLESNHCLDRKNAVSLFYTDTLKDKITDRVNDLTTGIMSIENYTRGTIGSNNPTLNRYLTSNYNSKENVYTQNDLNSLFQRNTSNNPILTTRDSNPYLLIENSLNNQRYLTKSEGGKRYYKKALDDIDRNGSTVPRDYLTRSTATTEFEPRAANDNPHITYSYLLNYNKFENYLKNLKEKLDSQLEKESSRYAENTRLYNERLAKTAQTISDARASALSYITTTKGQCDSTEATSLANEIQGYKVSATQIITELRKAIQFIDRAESTIADAITAANNITQYADLAKTAADQIQSYLSSISSYHEKITNATTDAIIATERDKYSSDLRECSSRMTILTRLYTNTQSEYDKISKRQINIGELVSSSASGSDNRLELQKIYTNLYNLFIQCETIKCDVAYQNVIDLVASINKYILELNQCPNRLSIQSDINKIQSENTMLQQKVNVVTRTRTSAIQEKNTVQTELNTCDRYIKSLTEFTEQALNSAKTHYAIAELAKGRCVTAITDCLNAEKECLQYFNNAKDIYDQTRCIESFTSEENPIYHNTERYDIIVARLSDMIEEVGLFKERLYQTIQSQFNMIFTNAGKTGKTGPSYEQCMKAYNPTGDANHWINNPNIFKVNRGIQELTIQESGNYIFTIAGARGGGEFGGKGHIGTVSKFLQKGTVLRILIGQAGSVNTRHNNGGGGGASYVVTQNDTIIGIAAGGGGAGIKHFDMVQINQDKGLDAGQITYSFILQFSIRDELSQLINQYLRTKKYTIALHSTGSNLHGGQYPSIYKLEIDITNPKKISDGKGIQRVSEIDLKDDLEVLRLHQSGAGGGYLTDGINEKKGGKSFKNGGGVGGGELINTGDDVTGTGGFGGGGSAGERGGGGGGGAGGGNSDTMINIVVKDSNKIIDRTWCRTVGGSGKSYNLKIIGHNEYPHGFVEVFQEYSLLKTYRDNYLYLSHGLLLEEHLYSIVTKYLTPDANGVVSNRTIQYAMTELKKLIDFNKSSFDTHFSIYLQMNPSYSKNVDLNLSSIKQNLSIYNEIIGLFNFDIMERITNLEIIIKDIVNYIQSVSVQEHFTSTIITDPFMLHPKYF